MRRACFRKCQNMQVLWLWILRSRRPYSSIPSGKTKKDCNNLHFSIGDFICRIYIIRDLHRNRGQSDPFSWGDFCISFSNRLDCWMIPLLLLFWRHTPSFACFAWCLQSKLKSQPCLYDSGISPFNNLMSSTITSVWSEPQSNRLILNRSDTILPPKRSR
jgi:hypothetical protein